jgi:Tol biopolymer transport system component
MKLEWHKVLLCAAAISLATACQQQAADVSRPTAGASATGALNSPLSRPVATVPLADAPVAPPPYLQGILLYHSDVGQRLFQIYSIALGGTDRVSKQLTADLDRTIEPHWSPNGKHIAYSSAKTNRDGLDLWLMNTDGSNQKQLTHHTGYALSPTWNHDGTKLLFYTTWDGKFQLYELELSTSALMRISASNGYNDYMPDYSPDGRAIAFSSDRSGREEIWAMDTDGSNPRQLTNAPVRNWRPRWSPNGARILYQQISQNYWELRLMNADGSQDAALFALPYIHDGVQITEIQDAVWVDNQTILFAGQTPDSYDIFSYNLATRQLRSEVARAGSDEMWPMLRPGQ